MGKTKNLIAFKLLVLLFTVGFATSTQGQYCSPKWTAQAGNCSGADLITNVSIPGTVLNDHISACNGTSRYKDFTGKTPAILYKNSGYNTYSLSVTANCPSGSTISVWIDFNQDYTFSSWEWYQVSSNSNQNTASTISITIPDTALLGSTVMRIRTRSGYSNGSNDACTQFATGVAYDYSIVIDSLSSCSGQPTAGNVFVQDTVCNGNQFCLAAVNGSMGITQLYQWQYSTDNIKWLNISNSNNYYIYTTQYASTYYRFFTTCTGSTDTSASVLVNSKVCYCAASANSSLDDDIGNFTMGSYSNGSDTVPATNNTKATGTYTDNTRTNFGTFFKGNSYRAKITQINSNAFFYPCFGKVYIDFDQSGTFDAAEEVDTGQTYTGNRRIYGNIDIPYTAKTGYTALRVVLKENGTYATTNACGTFNYGEVEDYTILILDQANKDISVTSIISPPPSAASCSGSSSQNISIKIQNTGIDTLDFAIDTLKVGVNIDISGSASSLSTKITSGTLAPMAYKTISLSNNYNMSGVGIYSFKAWSQMSADTVLINDSVDGPIIYIQQIISPTASSPYFQNFENGNGDWLTSGTLSSWVLGAPTKSIIDTASTGGSKCWTTSLASSYNYNERSYLQSPCFDLHGLDSMNTAVSFDIWWNCERDYDGLTLQVSTDDGNTWSRLGSSGEGTNWYNDTVITTTAIEKFLDGPHSWSGRSSSFDGSGGWLKATHILPTSLFYNTVKFRFAFASDYAVVDDGIAIDNFSIHELPQIDAAVTKMILPVATPCKNSKQDLTIQILNSGTNALNLSANSLKITIVASNAGSGTYSKTFSSGVINPGQTMNFNVVQNFNMGTVGTYNFKVYCYTAKDGDRSNDTNIFVRNTSSSSSLPEFQNFEGIINAGYTGTTNVAVNAGSGIGGSRSLRISVNSTTPYALAQTPNFGVIGKTTALKFDYRFSTTLSTDDTVNIYISIDCGVSFKNIYQFTNGNTSNTSYKTYQYDLGAYVGNNIMAMVEGKYGNTNFIMDIDNFAIDDKPDVKLGNDTVGCKSLILNADPNGIGWFLKWSDGHTYDTNTVFTTNHYWVKATDPYTGIYNTDTVYVEIYNYPKVLFGKDTAICSASGYVLSAGNWPANYKYSWSTGDTSANIIPLQTGMYICSVITPGGCVGTDTINLTVRPAPSGVSFAKGSTFSGSYKSGTSSSPDGVCTGNKIIYELTPPSIYTNAQYGNKWKLANAPTFKTVSGNAPSNGSLTITMPAASNGSVEFTPTSAEAGNTYILSATILDLVSGCDTTIQRYIDANSNFPINIGPDKDLCQGDTLLLDAGAANTYLWSTGETAQQIKITSGGTYWVSIVKNGGCASTDSISINLLPAPNSDFNIAMPSNKTINCTPFDGTLNGYTWDFGDGNQSNLKNSSHIYANDGTYNIRLTATDAKGCSHSTVKSLNTSADISQITNPTFSASVLPNPYKSETILFVYMSETKDIKIELYDMNGRLLSILNNGILCSGSQQIKINTQLYNASGIYNIRISSSNDIYNIKMIDLGQ